MTGPALKQARERDCLPCLKILTSTFPFRNLGSVFILSLAKGSPLTGWFNCTGNISLQAFSKCLRWNDGRLGCTLETVMGENLSLSRHLWVLPYGRWWHEHERRRQRAWRILQVHWLVRLSDPLLMMQRVWEFDSHIVLTYRSKVTWAPRHLTRIQYCVHGWVQWNFFAALPCHFGLQYGFAATIQKVSMIFIRLVLTCPTSEYRASIVFTVNPYISELDFIFRFPIGSYISTRTKGPCVLASEFVIFNRDFISNFRYIPPQCIMVFQTHW